MGLIMLLLITVMASSQAVEKVVVNANDLTPEQLIKINEQKKIDAVEQKIETYGKWVGVGGEIGVAIKDGLNAVVDVSDKFGKTDVGRFTMIMIAYKIMGKDIIRIFIGLLFILLFTFFIFRYYRTTFLVQKIVIEDNGWKFWLPKKYELREPDTYEGYQFVKFLTLVAFVGGYGIAYAIMFA